MLIEAARGGHTTVANLILRQPKVINSHSTPSSVQKEAGNATQTVAESRKTASSRKTSSGSGKHKTSFQDKAAQQTNNLQASENHLMPEEDEGGGGRRERQPQDEHRPKQESKKPVGDLSTAGIGIQNKETLGAKRQKMSDEAGRKPTIPTAVAHDYAATAQQPYSKHLQFASQSVPPDLAAKYAADSSTALKNIQRLTATSVAAAAASLQQQQQLQQKQRGGGSFPQQDGNHAPITPDDIIQGHVTSEDIVTQYWLQQAVKQQHHPHSHHPHIPLHPLHPLHPHQITSDKTTTLTNATHGSSQSADTAVKQHQESLLESAQSMFSAGNFSTHAFPTSPGVPTASQTLATPKFHASLNATLPETSQQNSAPPLNQNAQNLPMTPQIGSLTNADINRLIPHLEALAGSLQNPSSPESQYLAALAQSQLMPAALAHLAGMPQVLTGIDSPQLANVGVDGKPLPNLEDATTLPNMAKFIPNAAGPHVDQELSTQPIYTTDFSAGLKQLSRTEHSTSESHDIAEGGVEDLLRNRPRSLSTSFLLDRNFPLDIPPPTDLIPDHVSIYVWMLIFHI